MKRSGKRGRYDVIVVGGGPAGAVVGWRLASTGAKVLVLERTRYPREKVCGDYVEPRGLRVLEAMGCLTSLEADSPLPITHSSTYVEFRRVYSGPIPFYGRRVDLPAHGYIVPRERLDHEMIQAAERAGVIVREQTLVNNVLATAAGVEVRAQHDGREIVEAPLPAQFREMLNQLERRQRNARARQHAVMRRRQERNPSTAAPSPRRSDRSSGCGLPAA